MHRPSVLVALVLLLVLPVTARSELVRVGFYGEVSRIIDPGSPFPLGLPVAGEIVYPLELSPTRGAGAAVVYGPDPRARTSVSLGAESFSSDLTFSVSVGGLDVFSFNGVADAGPDLNAERIRWRGGYFFPGGQLGGADPPTAGEIASIGTDTLTVSGDDSSGSTSQWALTARVTFFLPEPRSLLLVTASIIGVGATRRRSERDLK